jgi:probable rRNA maturation factor
MSDGASTTGEPLVVVGHDERDGPPAVDLERWVAVARGALVHEGIAGPGELTLVFVDEAEMADLNRHYMGVDGPTDVLAFPIDAADAPPRPGGAVPPRLLGDVVVCPEVARRYAGDKGMALEDELALLVVHGVLHVLGHDHVEPAEAEAMRAREVALLAALHRDGAP